jgi:hypothetical protein
MRGTGCSSSLLGPSWRPCRSGWTPLASPRVPRLPPHASGGVVLDDALRGQGTAQVVKLYAEKSGYDPADLSGHSLRSGFLTSAVARGASIFKLIEVSRDRTSSGRRSAR